MKRTATSFLSLCCIGAVLVGCMSESGTDSMILTQLAEDAEQTRSTRSATLGFYASEGWSLVGPNVWHKETEHPTGGVSVSYGGHGAEGLAWMADMIWGPELRELQEAIDLSSDLRELDRLALRAAMLSRRLEVAEDWRARHLKVNSENDELTSPPSIECAPTASASAMATSGGAGAKSYSNAMTCIFGEEASGWASSWSQPSGGDSQY